MDAKKIAIAEFIRYFPHFVPAIDLGRGFVKNDFIPPSVGLPTDK